MSARTKHGWVKLEQPRVALGKDTHLFSNFGGSLVPVKAESEFDYNIRGARVGPDTKVSGWMFSETMVWEPISKLRFEFVDMSKETHTIELSVSTAKFDGPPIQADLTYNNIDPTIMEFDNTAPVPSMTPELQAYLKEMDMLSVMQDRGFFSNVQDTFDALHKQVTRKKSWWSILRWQDQVVTK